MQQALTSSLARAVVFGGLLLAATLVLPRAGAASHREVRLVLHTSWEPGYVYLSWWSEGDVRLDIGRGEAPPRQFTTRAWVNDGCHWKGIETLERIDDRHYAYRYNEVILHCRPGATPYLKTPRTGVVTIED